MGWLAQHCVKFTFDMGLLGGGGGGVLGGVELDGSSFFPDADFLERYGLAGRREFCHFDDAPPFHPY